MFDYEYRSTTTAGRVCLEISLKPFGRDKTPDGYETVARELFTQWKPLLKYATGIAVLFWTSDGSEILEYTGRMEDTFEWCRYIGIGNWQRFGTANPNDPNDNSLHRFPIHYIENPPEMTYGDLRDIIATVKRVGREITGFEIEVGETFDPGPEFAYSAFKFERHFEICQGNTMGAKQWVHCASALHADSHAYAAYPDGVPEGTHLGTFLGRQFMAMKRDLGFDYLWLSNGFGFSLSSWSWKGEIFNGERFDFAGADGVRQKIADFWTHFMAEVGDMRIEVRGSNLSAGMDIAAHGCPIDDIYRQNIIAPPNSPWAPLNYRFGLELAGFMSHIAALPEKGFNLRYYIHDPWWLNSPWFDRYDRSPHDIYLPLGIARLDETLSVTKPFGLSFLSADDSFGRLPDRCPNEVIPHLLTAYNDYPDAPGLVTWVYPISTYCKTGLYDGHPERIFSDDWFMESAVDIGFPVNTVISDDNFIKALQSAEARSALSATILITPIPDAGSAMEAAVFTALESGLRVMLYGSARNASEKLRTMIGVTLGGGIDGTLSFATTLPQDTAETDAYANIMTHVPLLSNGGIEEIPTGDGNVVTTATVEKDGVIRAYATYNHEQHLVWIRSSFPHRADSHGDLPVKLSPAESFPPALLTRASLSLFGFPLTFSVDSVCDNLPIVQFASCRNAIFYNLFAKDASVRMHLSTPDGAPAFDNTEFTVENSLGTYPMTRWMHTDCRIFVKQESRSKICIKRDDPHNHIDLDERFTITGLRDATLTVFPSKGGIAWASTDPWSFFHGPNVDSSYDAARGCYIFAHVTGYLNVLIQEQQNIGDYRKLEFLRNRT